MNHVTVKTKDVRRFDQAINDLLNRSKGVEGQGVVWGPPGVGKTTALTLLANDYDAVYIRALGCSTVTSILGDICRYLGGERKCRRSDMVDFIVTKLTRGVAGEPKPVPRPIIVDEADYCIKQFDIMDSLRDVYDISGCPVILVGMEDIARRLQENGRFARRLTQWIEFRGLDLDDTVLVAAACCEVELKDDLIEYVHRETCGNVGRIKVGLDKIEKVARANGKSVMSLSDWGGRPLYFDQPIFGKSKKPRA
jgi:DNA transposition AAA+ family ATPase